MTRVSLQDFLKSAVILLGLTLISCAKNDENASSFRIVGLNGETRQVQTRVPELNARILESQGRQLPPQNQESVQASQNPSQQYSAPSNQGMIPENNRSLQETMQADQGKPSYNVPASEVAQNTKPIEDKASVGAPEKDQEIQYDLSDSDKPAKKSAKKMHLKSGKSVEATAKEEDKSEEEEAPVVSKGKKKIIFVQTGSFSAEENAKQDFAKVQKFSKGKIEEADVGGKKIYRVLLGPVANDKKAKELLGKVKNNGHEAIVVKK